MEYIHQTYKSIANLTELNKDNLFVYLTNPQNISKHKYQNRDVFLSDVSLIHANSIKYNGKHVTIVAMAAVIVFRKCKAEQEFS